MSGDKQLLEVTVAAEELPERLLVNGVEYRQVGEPPDRVTRELVEAILYFEGLFGSGNKSARLLEGWLRIYLHSR